jgi:hypothetical protein
MCQRCVAPLSLDTTRAEMLDPKPKPIEHFGMLGRLLCLVFGSEMLDPKHQTQNTKY